MSDERTIPDDALPACCVRIDVGGAPAGSGFFVAPGVVVTCYHVLRLERLSSDEADPELSVVSGDRKYDVRDWREYSPTNEDDLAILRVEAADDHPCVLLDTGLRARDELHSYGFPDGRPGGEPTPIRAAGWVGGKEDQWLKLVESNIRRGMSGSPVLNLRTGAVCGVLKRSSDPTQALGGYAVSVSALFALSPSLLSQNYRHHTTNRGPWFDLLPPAEKRLLLRQRAPERPAEAPAEILVLSVSQTEESWTVSAVRHRCDDGEWIADPPLTSVSVDLNTVRTLVARLFRDWASREATPRGRVEPGDQIRLLGEILSSALLRDDVRSTFDALVDTAAEDRWIEVALHFDDLADEEFREFVELPWEHLYIPKSSSRADLYFARATNLAFVRALHPEPAREEPPEGKLSMLVISTKPPESPDPARRPEDVKAAFEIDQITAGLQSLGDKWPDRLEVQVAASPGTDEVVDSIREGRYDIVHYVGFGRFDSGSDRIALHPTPAYTGFVNPDDFADCLEDAMPRLVVLQSARGSEAVPADLATFAPTLLMSRNPARGVVAHQYPVAAELTVKFNASLYGALLDGAALEAAAQDKRKKVWSSDADSRAFLSPAVFVRRPGGVPLVQRRERGVRSRVGALPAHA